MVRRTNVREHDSADALLVDDIRNKLGSVRQLAAYEAGMSATTIENYLEYDSFGNITQEETPAVDHVFGYTGRERDEETGMHFYRARYFDPVVGRFISEDPIGFEAEDANLYRYVENRSIVATDPTGHEESSPAKEFMDNATDADVTAWIAKFEKQFGDLITQSAKRNTVPRELLGAVVANEYMDIQDGEDWAAKWANYGDSLGPAQIHIRLARKYPIVDMSFGQFNDALRKDYPTNPPSQNRAIELYEEYLRKYLIEPKTNIDAAGKLMAIYLDVMSSQLEEKTTGTDPNYSRGTFSSSFLQDIVSIKTNVGSPNFDRFVNELHFLKNGRS